MLPKDIPLCCTFPLTYPILHPEVDLSTALEEVQGRHTYTTWIETDSNSSNEIFDYIDLGSPVEKYPSSKQHYFQLQWCRMTFKPGRMSEMVSENIAHVIPFQTHFAGSSCKSAKLSLVQRYCLDNGITTPDKML